MASAKSTKSESPVAARAEANRLEDEQNADDTRQERLEEQAKEQEKQQKAALRAGRTGGAMADAEVAEQRARTFGVKPDQGRVDNMTRQNDAQPLQGHFVTIDYSDFGKDALALVESIVGEGNAHAGSADYGVYLHPGDINEDGYPETAVVLLRDEHAAQVVVPYDSLVAVNSSGRH